MTAIIALAEYQSDWVGGARAFDGPPPSTVNDYLETLLVLEFPEMAEAFGNPIQIDIEEIIHGAQS